MIKWLQHMVGWGVKSCSIGQVNFFDRKYVRFPADLNTLHSLLFLRQTLLHPPNHWINILSSRCLSMSPVFWDPTVNQLGKTIHNFMAIYCRLDVLWARLLWFKYALCLSAPGISTLDLQLGSLSGGLTEPLRGGVLLLG